MKKIYFTCSIRGGRDDQPTYKEIVELIKERAEVLTELFADDKLTAWGHDDLSDVQIHERDLAWIAKSDAIIAEVSTPSLGVGYEIAMAGELGKPALALYRPKPDRRLSAMINGSPGVKVIVYQKVSELEKPLKDFLKD